MPRPSETWAAEPIRGVEDHFLERRAPGFVQHIRNGRVAPYGVVPRPGFRAQSSGTISGTYICQMLADFTRATDGTRVGAMVFNGQIYYTTNAFSTVSLAVSAANFTTAGITVDTTTSWRYCVYMGTLIISDGVNKPFQWNGTTGAGGLTSLSNAPTAPLGAPTVYYAKLFFLKDRFTVVWSEENAPNTGYEAGGFNNAWTLSQSDSDAIYQLLGTNEGIYFFRAASIGLISGAVTPDFSTSGVQDSVSNVVGSTAYHPPLLTDTHIWFTDRTGRPWALPRGGGAAVPVWHSLRWLYGPVAPTASWAPSIVTYDRRYADLAQFAYHGGHGLVLVSVPYDTGLTGQGHAKGMAVFDAATLICYGLWDASPSVNIDYLATAEVYNSGAGAATSQRTDGVVFGTNESKIGIVAQVIEADNYSGSVFVPVYEIWGAPTDGLSLVNYYFTEAQVFTTVRSSASAPARYTKVTFSYLTSNTPAYGDKPTAQTLNLSDIITGAGGAAAVVNIRGVFGLNGYGRWLLPVIQLQQYTGAGVEEAPLDVILQGCTVRGYTADLEHATK